MIEKITFARRIFKSPLRCGKSILELTEFEGVAYWWNVNFLFHQHVLGLIDGSCDFRLPSKAKRAIKYAYRRIFEPCLKFVYKLVGCRVEGNPSALPKGIFICREDERATRDIETGKLVRSDFIFDALVTGINDRFNLQGVYFTDSLKFSTNQSLYSAKKKNRRLSQKPVDIYWDRSVGKRYRSARKVFRKAWELLKNDPSLVALCSFEGVDYNQPIMEHLEFCFLELLPLAVRAEKLGENIIKKEKADFVLVEYEYGPIRKSLGVIAPKKLGLPSIAIQHGNIYPTHPGYYYLKEETAFSGSSGTSGCLLPDITCLFGEKYRRILGEECGYPEEALIITGQPRYDIFYHTDRLFSKQSFRERFGIPEGKRAVLWTTQSHGMSDEENIANLKAVAASFGELENTILIVKQHPNETDKYTQLIKSYLESTAIDLRVMPRDSDTFEQLYFCDIVISKFSTTATEAVVMGKPLIILNLGGAPDRVDYVDEGVAIGVYEQENLTPAIKQLFKDSSFLEENRQRYVSENLYKIDGKDSSRVGDAIDVLLRIPSDK